MYFGLWITNIPDHPSPLGAVWGTCPSATSQPWTVEEYRGITRIVRDANRFAVADANRFAVAYVY
jgi:hypothetical protein